MNSRVFGMIESVTMAGAIATTELRPLTLVTAANGVEFRGNGQEFFVPWDFVLSAASALRDELSKHNAGATCPCCGSRKMCTPVTRVEIVPNEGRWQVKECDSGVIWNSYADRSQCVTWIAQRPSFVLATP